MAWAVEICQLLPAWVFAEYHQCTTKMLQIIATYRDVRSPSNRHAITAHTYCTYQDICTWKCSTRSSLYYPRVSTPENQTDTRHNEISRRQISLKSSYYHCRYILRALQHQWKELINSFRHGHSQNKRCLKNKTKLTVRNAYVHMSCSRSVKHCFFD